jgi:hypothetical protein
MPSEIIWTYKVEAFIKPLKGANASYLISLNNNDNESKKPIA